MVEAGSGGLGVATYGRAAGLAARWRLAPRTVGDRLQRAALVVGAWARGTSGARPTSLSWAITTAVPSPRVVERWGDWHFAQALARSLRRSGHRAVVQRLDQADSPAGRACDVHLVLHGLRSVPRTGGRRAGGQGHILWVISHPETLTDADCDDADLVLVASERFAEHLRGRTATPVEVLLQATDHHRFRPVAPRPEHRHDVTVVAKTRDVRRAIVSDAIEAGLRPSIYGGGWRSLVDPALVVADHIDNRDLPAVYCSAGVVLNDHWEAMRDWGFVSNRLFDVLACGVPVISDPVVGLSDLFSDAVPAYENPEQLRRLVDDVLGDPPRARDRARQGQAAVLASHTFDHRAATLIAHVGRHLPHLHREIGPQP